MRLQSSPDGALCAARSFRTALAALTLLACTAGTGWAGDPAELLTYVPPTANSIVLIDAEQLMNSEMAIRGGWKDKQEFGYGQRPLAIPPEAGTIVVGAQLNPLDNLAVEWQIALSELSEDFPIRAIARSEGGYVDEIRGRQVAWTPSNAYVVDVAPRTQGMVFPADRQAASRWIAHMNSETQAGLSEYLTEAAARLEGKTQIVVALDLTDVMQPHLLRERLGSSQAMINMSSKVEQVANVVQGLRGVTLTVDVGNRALGKLQVDFAGETAPIGTLAKPLVLEVMQGQEAYLPDLENWTAVTENNSIVMRGTLSENGLRRIGSLLELPTTKYSDLKDAEPAEPGTPDYARASQAYFKSVSTLIDDLRSSLKSHRDNHALWFERYARKIDALPILNVDEELLNWGASVASTFRNIGVAERSSGVRQGVRKSQTYGDYSYSTSGYYSYRPQSSRKTQIKREEEAKATLMRADSWKDIEDATAAIRRSMTQKYGVEF